jgi:hypothetical protein
MGGVRLLVPGEHRAGGAAMRWGHVPDVGLADGLSWVYVSTGTCRVTEPASRKLEVTGTGWPLCSD